MFLFIFIFAFELGSWIITAEDGMIIQPFETDELGKNISGGSIAHLLNCEFQSISEAGTRMNDTEFNKIISGTIDVPHIQSESIKYSIINLGSVGMGSSSFSIGQLAFSLKQLLKTQPAVLKGSINKYGSTLSIAATMEFPSSSDLKAWKVSKNLSNMEKSIENYVPVLVKDLAYQIALDDAKKTNDSTSDSPRAWQTFESLIEGQKSCLDYYDTGNEEFLYVAKQSYLNALELEPNFNETKNMLYKVGIEYLGLYVENKKDYNKSIKYFRNAENIFKKLSEMKSFEGATALGLLYMEKNEYESSLKAFNDSITLEPNSEIAWYNKGALLQQKGDLLLKNGNPQYDDYYDRANIYYNISLGLNPKYSRALNNKGMISFARGQYSEAIDNFRKASKDMPIAMLNEARALSKLGIETNNLSIINDSISRINIYLIKNSTDSIIWNELGNAYFYKGDYSNAAKAYSNYTHRNFRNSVGWCNKGRALYLLSNHSRYSESLDAFNEAIYCNKTDPLPWLYKSKILLELGKCDQAKQAYNESIRLNKNSLNDSRFAIPPDFSSCN